MATFVKKHFMPELTITYEKKETLKILKDISKYLGFTVSVPKPKKGRKITIVNGVTVVRKSTDFSSMDKAAMNDALERGKMDAKELRSRWQRK